MVLLLVLFPGILPIVSVSLLLFVVMFLWVWFWGSIHFSLTVPQLGEEKSPKVCKRGVARAGRRLHIFASLFKHSNISSYLIAPKNDDDEYGNNSDGDDKTTKQ